ncbi:MAG TPA: CehA/McbA family metallohydrolase [Vicinamibacterales bacterium]|nr:CehA/McbA family metallohydrolase [Vicinamibacterales bacterium]
MSDRIGRRALLRQVAELALVAAPLLRAVRADADVLELQPLLAQVRRVLDAMHALGEPFAEADIAALTAAENGGDAAAIAAAVDRVLASRCLAEVRINPEARVSVTRGPAEARLAEHGWRAFLIKVRNEAGVTARLLLESPQARPVYRPATGNAMAPPSVRQADVLDRWLAIEMYDEKPLEPPLSGLPLEYRVVTLYSRDRGRREAQIGATIGSGSEDIGFRNRVAIVFHIDPSEDVGIRVRDEHGRPAVASLLVEDRQGRVYPARSKRLAPDFFFQRQVYRADGETIRLPAGEFTATCGRGPEYVTEQRRIEVRPGVRAPAIDVQLRRWIDPAARGWYSGDHHIHAAGCSHYESPTEGVRPEDMMRHVLGEALSVGAVLNWGPGYYHQRQYFEGKEHRLSTRSTLLRYDLEVSGFPSSHCGHLVLLRLREQDYPDTRQIEDWPSWDLPILKWAKGQGAVAGFAHSGWGLQVNSHALPNLEMPPFDGIGANEYIVDVTHDAVDFISACDTPYAHELNIWYHTLNCGYRARISGETDFPCITDERVGGGRSYVRVDGALSYDGWCEGVRRGRTYVSDGFSHLMDFAADGVPLGGSDLQVGPRTRVTLTAACACLLPSQAPAAKPDPSRRPFWTPEHARVPGTREAVVEAVVNGQPVARQRIRADGTVHDVRLEVAVERSSWIALRILGSAHTNPIFARVDGKEIRASRKSAEWCAQAVDLCWAQKSPRIRARERDAARAAFDVARERYREVLRQSDAD